jgi:hypothetical protein
MMRRSYLYSLAPERLSTAAAAVAAEIKDTARQLVESGIWSGVELIPPMLVQRVGPRSRARPRRAHGRSWPAAPRATRSSAAAAVCSSILRRASSGIAARIGVSMIPGDTALTRTGAARLVLVLFIGPGTSWKATL